VTAAAPGRRRWPGRRWRAFIEDAQVRTLYHQLSPGLVANLVLATVVAWSLRSAASARLLLAWVLGLLAVSLARWALLRAYARRRPGSAAARWRRLFIAGSSASAALWGVSGWLLAGGAPLELQVLVTFVVGGLCAGAVSALGTVWPAFVAYTLASLAPLAVWLTVQGGEVQLTMAGLVAVYGLVLLGLARRHYRSAVRSLALGCRNDELVGRLRTTNRELLEANERLAAEVAERRGAEQELRASEARFRDIAETAADWFWECDRGLTCTGSWGRARDLLGLADEAIIGRGLGEIITAHAVDPEVAERCRLDMAAEGTLDQVELRWRRDDGAVRVLRLSARPIYGPRGRFAGYRGAARDATEEHRLAARLAYQARHDPLTGLIGRRELERRLGRVLAETQEAPEHALCYLDLDQFKVINDTCGHAAGDDLLRQLGALLKQHMRQRDSLARLGGDEFAALLEHCPLDQARRVANELRAAVEEYRFKWEDKVFNVCVSVGVVAVGGPGQTVSDCLRAADAACYAAKDEGRNRVHTYRPDDGELARRFGEMRWVAEITRALEEDRFELMYQPIRPVSPGLPEGHHYELLLRMRDRDGRAIPPGAFLPAAERFNLAARLDRWVVDTAFGWLAARPRHLARLDMCAINLSGQTLGDEALLARLIEHLSAGAVPAEKLCFEITETAAIANLEQATRFMRALKALGCRFALDDFGSGLSSFAYLKGLPVDLLKIDGVFVKDMVNDPIDCAMVRAINEIGRVMGKRTVAEFVEDQAVLARLREVGVDYAQGYGIGRPRPLAELDLPETVTALAAHRP